MKHNLKVTKRWVEPYSNTTQYKIKTDHFEGELNFAFRISESFLTKATSNKGDYWHCSSGQPLPFNFPDDWFKEYKTGIYMPVQRTLNEDIFSAAYFESKEYKNKIKSK